MSRLEFKPQDRQSIDFAESERQKSNNLFCITQGYTKQSTNIMYTIDQNSQTVVINGSNSNHSSFALTQIKTPILLANKTYTISVEVEDFDTISITNLSYLNTINPTGGNLLA